MFLEISIFQYLRYYSKIDQLDSKNIKNMSFHESLVLSINFFKVYMNKIQSYINYSVLNIVLNKSLWGILYNIYLLYRHF